jgi:hypothetical protein
MNPGNSKRTKTQPYLPRFLRSGLKRTFLHKVAFVREKARGTQQVSFTLPFFSMAIRGPKKDNLTSNGSRSSHSDLQGLHVDRRAFFGDLALVPVVAHKLIELSLGIFPSKSIPFLQPAGKNSAISFGYRDVVARELTPLPCHVAAHLLPVPLYLIPIHIRISGVS